MDTARRLGALFAVCLFSCSALAAPVQSGVVVAVEDCELLGEPVSIVLSKDVKASYVCDTHASSINFATCHSYGRKKATLSDGAQTTTGIVYRISASREGPGMTDVAGCPSADVPIPDETVVSGIE